MDANGGPKGEGQTLKQLRRTLELEGVDDDAGSDQIQTDFGQNPAVLRLQQMQADQEPAQDDTQKSCTICSSSINTMKTFLHLHTGASLIVPRQKRKNNQKVYIA